VQQVTVGVRELKANLSRYLRLVRQGGSVTITARGQAIGRIVPLSKRGEPVEPRAWALVEAGLASWGGGKLTPRRPPAKLRGEKTVAELLVEDRE